MYRLTSSLPYLLNRVGVRLGELFSLELEQLGLTLPMYRVLAALLERNDQRLTDLSAITGAEMTTSSRLTSAMERRGYLTRRRPEDNMRTVIISLTDLGRETAEQIFPRAQYYENTATTGIPKEDVERMKAWLIQILDNMVDLDPATELDSLLPERGGTDAAATRAGQAR